MSLYRIVVSLALLLAAASASELTVKIVDPGSSVVAGAQVTLLQENGSQPLQVESTSAEGEAIFRGLSRRPYRVQISAPGFAQSLSVIPSFDESPVTIQLHLATASESVEVTATRIPVPSAVSGSDVESLNAGQIISMQPVSEGDALRFLPGVVVDANGRRGALASLFVRGGDSRYNKVIIDGVTANDSGGTFDFGVVPLEEADRLELVRGAQSTLYGSDAMTSVVQIWTRTGSTPVPELRFGADGGTFETAHGYMSLAGARGIFDYNLFGDQFNSSGQGPNDEYSNSSQGANLGVRLGLRVAFRLRARHSNNRTGVPSFWNFDGQTLIPPDLDQRARQNNFLGSAELTLTGPSRWQHRFTGFESNHKRTNVDDITDPGRVSPLFGNIDFPFAAIADFNRAGFEYEGDYWARSWALTTVGYQFEDENGFVGDLTSPPLSHGLRLNHAVYGQELLTLGRFSAVVGGRFVHNGSFGNKAVPRVALTLQALKGAATFSGTRLRFSYATGIKEPRFEESFASGPFTLPNPNLKAEENRAFEAGIQQGLLSGKYSLSATYFNNLFRNQIDFGTLPNSFVGQYVNVNQSLAHGAEVELHGRPWSRLSLDAGYNYTSTQILKQPFAFDPLLFPGQPLLRRPKHSGSLLFTCLGNRWGGNLGGSFVGRRLDSDFLGFGINHAAGYARVDLGAWYAINSRVTAYVDLGNVLNKHYEEVAGYPALRANFRAGMRFRIGGE